MNRKRIANHFLAAALIVLSAVSCIDPVRNDEAAACLLNLKLGAPETKVTGATAAAESHISSANVYIYNMDSGLPVFVAGRRTVSGVGIQFSGLPMGGYKAVVIANAPSSLSSELPYEVLMRSVSSAADNCENLVMTGEKDFTLSQRSQDETVRVERLAARISLGRVTNRIGSGSTVTLQSIYIINAAGNTDYAGVASPTVWLNKMGFRDEVSSILSDEVGAPVPYGAAYEVEHAFYCYPNATSADASGGTWSARHTRLVLKCSIADANHSAPCYYCVTLPPLKRNREYVISEIILNREGNDADHEDYGVEMADAVFNTSVSEWGTAALSLLFTEQPVNPSGRTLSGISVNPGSWTAASGDTWNWSDAVVVTAHYDDGSSETVTSLCSWTSADPSVVSGGERAAALAAGVTTVTAGFGGFTAQISVTVTASGSPDEPEDEWTGEYTYGEVSVRLSYSPDPMAGDGSQSSYPRVTYSQERCKVYSLSGEVFDRFLTSGGTLSFEKVSGDGGMSVDSSDGEVTAAANPSTSSSRSITVRVTVTLHGISGYAEAAVTQMKYEESAPVIVSTETGVRYNEDSESRWRRYTVEEDTGWWTRINGEESDEAVAGSGAGSTPAVVTAGHTHNVYGYRVPQTRITYYTRDVLHWSDGSVTYANEEGPFYDGWEDSGSEERDYDADSSTAAEDVPAVVSGVSWLNSDGTYEANTDYGGLLSIEASAGEEDIWYGEATSVSVTAEYGPGDSRVGVITSTNGTASATLTVVQEGSPGGAVDVTGSVTFPGITYCIRSGGTYTHNLSGQTSDERRYGDVSYGGMKARFSFVMHARYASRIKIDAISDGMDVIKPGFTVWYNDNSAADHHVNGSCDCWCVDSVVIEAGMEADAKDFGAGIHAVTIWFPGGRDGTDLLSDSESVEIRNNKWYNYPY